MNNIEVASREAYSNLLNTEFEYLYLPKATAFIKGATSEAACDFWRHGMYSENDVIDILNKFKMFILTPEHISSQGCQDWLSKNKTIK